MTPRNLALALVGLGLLLVPVGVACWWPPALAFVGILYLVAGLLFVDVGGGK